MPTVETALEAIQRLKAALRGEVALGYNVGGKIASLGLRDPSIRGNTAFLNLIQNSKGFGEKILLSYAPSEADLGTYIEQFKNPEAGLYSIENGAFFKSTPNRTQGNSRNRVQLPANDVFEVAMHLAPALDGLFAAFRQDSRFNNGSNKLEIRVKNKPQEWTVYVWPQPLRVTSFAPLPCQSNLAYSALGANGKAVFDSIFTYGSYALSSGKVIQSDAISVGALIVSERGQILSWGFDEAALVHAEIAAIKRYLGPGEAPAPNIRLYTSLEPCYMCSGNIHDVLGGVGLTVISGQLDPRISNQQLQTGLQVGGIPSGGLQSATATKLETKRSALDGLAKQDGTLSEHKKKAFESAIEQAKSIPGRRHHAKALIKLAELGPEINKLADLEKQSLTAVLSHVKEFFGTVTTTNNFKALLERIAAYLDETRGRNPFKKSPEYLSKAATAPAEQKYAKQAATLV
ncbi:MAG TPA: hypothetical protein VH325_03880 [Bryobacteraceae bacterium]|jgi:deoxycytidylate deaminase|nr:hypothetical protein [Bryobacteraceae bacterium]